MPASDVQDHKPSPLDSRHRSLSARMGTFGGWVLPIQYAGILEEHVAARTRAAVFDVSHMGEIEVAGTDAPAALSRLVSGRPDRLAVGRGQYTALTTPEGTCFDDLVVFRLREDHYLLVVNAENTRKDSRWLATQLPEVGDAVAVDVSARYAAMAVQGPLAAGILQSLTEVELGPMRPFECRHGEIAGVRATVARTGYTGEDGFELFVPVQSGGAVWDAILASGRDEGLVPAGLGARDTLRLEAGFRLYGADIDETTTLLEAGLGSLVDWTKDEFVGRDALIREREAGSSRQLVGFALLDRGIARAGFDIMAGGRPVGRVTSGTYAPTLERAIGLGYVASREASPGAELEIAVRQRPCRATIVPVPFYRRSNH